MIRNTSLGFNQIRMQNLALSLMSEWLWASYWIHCACFPTREMPTVTSYHIRSLQLRKDKGIKALRRWEALLEKLPDRWDSEAQTFQGQDRAQHEPSHPHMALTSWALDACWEMSSSTLWGEQTQLLLSWTFGVELHGEPMQTGTLSATVQLGFTEPWQRDKSDT